MYEHAYFSGVLSTPMIQEAYDPLTKHNEVAAQDCRAPPCSAYLTFCELCTRCGSGLLFAFGAGGQAPEKWLSQGTASQHWARGLLRGHHS